MAQLLAHTMTRFVVVGMATVVVDFTALYIAHGIIGLAILPATAVAFATAIPVNFMGQRSWVFNSLDKPYHRLGRYLAMLAVNAAMTLAIVTGLTAAGAYYLLAKMIAVVVVACVNYVAYRTWVFAR
jgi:putative flippase GtrA